MYFIYVLKVPLFERYRININKPWPWESDKQKWNKKLKKTIFIIFINHFVIQPTVTYISIFYTGTLFRTDLESFPEIKEILLQILLFMIAEDTAFYWAHRILHTPYLF